jgi:hypothetical protein
MRVSARAAPTMTMYPPGNGAGQSPGGVGSLRRLFCFAEAWHGKVVAWSGKVWSGEAWLGVAGLRPWEGASAFSGAGPLQTF